MSTRKNKQVTEITNDYLHRINVATKHDTSYFTSMNLINEMEAKLVMIAQLYPKVNLRTIKAYKSEYQIKQTLKHLIRQKQKVK
jgi:hypothetical protein